MRSASFQILGSSSAGNCALLRTPEATVLVDAGFSGRRIEGMLAQWGVALSEVDAVFVTHEHGDHCLGLGALARVPGIRFFANQDTASAIQQRQRKALPWEVFGMGADFAYRDLQVSAFPVPHDACAPVGYVFTGAGGWRVGWVTDLGYVPALVSERVREVDVLVLECNYDAVMLDRSERSWALKQRIKSRHGHLCNEAAFEMLRGVSAPRWRQVYLAHLSRDCNCPVRVRELFAPLAAARCFEVAVVAPEGGPVPPFLLGGAGG